MATLQFSVFGDASQTLLGVPIQEGVVVVGGASLQSAAITGGVSSGASQTARGSLRRVRVMSDTDCWVTWGEDPTALNTGAGGRMMGAENPETFGIQSGHKIAVIERV